jgi:hypothetical protein
MAINHYYGYSFSFTIDYFEVQFIELGFGFSKVK